MRTVKILSSSWFWITVLLTTITFCIIGHQHWFLPKKLFLCFSSHFWWYQSPILLIMNSVLIESTYELNYMILVFLCLGISLNLMTYVSNHGVINDRILFILCLNYNPLFTSATYLLEHISIDPIFWLLWGVMQ